MDVLWRVPSSLQLIPEIRKALTSELGIRFHGVDAAGEHTIGHQFIADHSLAVFDAVGPPEVAEYHEGAQSSHHRDDDWKIEWGV